MPSKIPATMNVLLFGATGMVGQGVLRECLLDPDVERVLIVGRTPSGARHEKLQEIVHRDLQHYSEIEGALKGFDACFFCLGPSAAGMTPEDYERATYGITLAAAEPLARLNPNMTFVYVSGAGTDSSEKGKVMWARVKGRTENALLRLPFAAAYMFRPGIIQPLYGARSKTTFTRIFYALAGWLLPVLRRAFPNYVLTTEEIGQAMLMVARHGYSKRILEVRDIRTALAPPRAR
jgi:uncharacterized protein YbjT (DUF2867 family)